MNKTKKILEFDIYEQLLVALLAEKRLLKDRALEQKAGDKRHPTSVNTLARVERGICT